LGDQWRTSGRIAVPPLADPEAWALLMVTNLNVGPGDPGPGDEWKIPMGPIDEIVGRDEAIREPLDAGHGVGLLHRLTHRG
jgi:hypothetical protein